MASMTRAVLAGWLGGFAGNALLGAAFSSPWISNILYNPTVQSQLFITVTPQRNIPVSVVGLIVLSGVHGLLFNLLQGSIPGNSWIKKGFWWGATIWAMYWLFQEWFIYVTLLQEPVALAMLELTILLLGSLVEGLVIAKVIGWKKSE